MGKINRPAGDVSLHNIETKFLPQISIFGLPLGVVASSIANKEMISQNLLADLVPLHYF